MTSTSNQQTLMETDIGRRLKFISKQGSISITQIANELGISKENLYKWTKGHKPSNIDHYTKLKDYVEKMEHKLGINDAPDTIPEDKPLKPSTIRLPLDPHKPLIEQYDGSAAAGTLILVSNSLELIVDRIDAPFLGMVEGAVEVEEDSMEPTFKNGCRVGIFRLRYPRLLNWGTCYYVLDKNRFGIIRRIYPSSEKAITLISDNENQARYPPIIKLWDDILAIFKVKAAIQKL